MDRAARKALGPPSPLVGEGDELLAMRSIVQSEAGEGSLSARTNG